MARSTDFYSLRKKNRLPRRLLIVVLALVCLLVAATAVVRYEYTKNLQPVSSSHQVHNVTVLLGSSASSIAKQLKQSGLIRSSAAFEWYVNSHEYRDKLQAGTYSFMPSQSTPQIVEALVNGKVATDLVTILPGQRLGQIRDTFIKSGFKPAAVDTALKAGQYRDAFPALADNPPSAGLEGFLYPDSYQKTANTDPKQIVQEALSEMQEHLTVELRNGFAKHGLTTYQGVTLASIIEQEVAESADKPKVAQVFLKRLHSGMTLGSDVTAYYGAIKDGQTPSLNYDSPYNTHLHKGLPPGPISAVSESSLHAAAHPAKTDWLYFVAGDNDKTYFSKTLEQHNANVDKYCHKKCSATE